MLQNALKLKAGDILIFGRTKQGELLLGGRARTASDKDRKAPPRTRKSDGAPGDKPVVKSAPQPHETLWHVTYNPHAMLCVSLQSGGRRCAHSTQAADGVLRLALGMHMHEDRAIADPIREWIACQPARLECRS